MPVAPVSTGSEAGLLNAADRERLWRFGVLVALYLGIVYLVPTPADVNAQGWRMFAIFVCVIVGMILEPIPDAAVVLLGITAFIAVGVPIRDALGGFAEGTVWMVLAALLMARVLFATGLARRIALIFVRAVGARSLGLGYALVFSDVTLAGGVPSNAARLAGMVMPIGRSIAEIYQSTPGPSAKLLGAYLMTTMYQGDVVACSMFITGQVSNLLGAALAARLANVHVTWLGWFAGAIVPGFVSLLLVPFVAYKLLPPAITHTPAATEFADRELARMGRPARDERWALAVFVGTALLWITSGWSHIEVSFAAFLALAVLFVSGTLQWADALAEHKAWHIFVWYGGLLRMGELLNSTGVTKAFATSVGNLFTGVPWFTALIGVVIIYYYAHYAFASITAHMLAMFPPFVALLIGLGAPPKLAVFSLLCLANLPAGLTHYGTTPAPVLFSQGYVSLKDWWRVGFFLSIVNLTVWLTIGLGWWKLLGFW
jgi:DASS family divalent anion:Na+ symporter